MSKYEDLAQALAYPRYLPSLRKYLRWLLIGSGLHLLFPLSGLVDSLVLGIIGMFVLAGAQFLVIWAFWMAYFDYFTQWLAYKHAQGQEPTDMEKFREWMASGAIVAGSLLFCLLFLLMALGFTILFFAAPSHFQSTFHISS